MLIIMVISSYNTYIIGYNNIITYNTICFNGRVFSYIKVIANDYFISSPNKNTSSAMEILPYFIFAPYSSFQEDISDFFQEIHSTFI